MLILEILFSIFVLLFPGAEVLRLQYSNNIAFTLNDVLLIVLVLYWVFYHIFTKKKVKADLFTKPVLIFAAIGVVSLILDYSHLTLLTFLVSFLYLVRWMMYLSLYYIVKDFGVKFRRKIPYLLLIAGIFIVAGGYVQYFLYPNLRNLYYLGWDEHLYRMFSSFLDPNFAGAFFVLLFILTAGVLYVSFKEKEYLRSAMFTVTGLLTFIAVYLTYSRSALIMLILSSMTFLYLIGKRKLIVFSVIFFVMIVFFLPRSFKTEGTNFLRTASSEARITSLERGFVIVKNNPILGVGFDAYRYAQIRYGLTAGQNLQTSHSGAGTDNSFLFVLATTGIIGFVTFLYILFKMFAYAKENFKKNILAVVLFSSLAGLVFDSFFINSLFYVFILEWVWILAATIENK